MPNKRTGPDYMDEYNRKRMEEWMQQQADSNFKKMNEKYAPKRPGPPQPKPPKPPKKTKKKTKK